MAKDIPSRYNPQGVEKAIYKRWQEDYNAGYIKLGKPNVVRPVLTRIPNKEKIIGGHCVLPNASILKEMEPKNVTGPIADYILRYSDKKSRVHRSKGIIIAKQTKEKTKDLINPVHSLGKNVVKLNVCAIE